MKKEDSFSNHLNNSTSVLAEYALSYLGSVPVSLVSRCEAWLADYGFQDLVKTKSAFNDYKSL